MLPFCFFFTKMRRSRHCCRAAYYAWQIGLVPLGHSPCGQLCADSMAALSLEWLPRLRGLQIWLSKQGKEEVHFQLMKSFLDKVGVFISLYHNSLVILNTEKTDGRRHYKSKRHHSISILIDCALLSTFFSCLLQPTD